jgi:hypothetical protein
LTASSGAKQKEGGCTASWWPEEVLAQPPLSFDQTVPPEGSVHDDAERGSLGLLAMAVADEDEEREVNIVVL